MSMLLKRFSFVMIVVTGLLLSAEVFAGDYTVSYAFDGTTKEDGAAGTTSSLNEEGTTKECQYERSCTIELAKSDLTISIDVRRSSRHEVVVYAYGGRSHSTGCCYFSGGIRVLNSTLLSHCFAWASTKGMLAKETKSSKTFIWGFSISSFQT
jgi:hypothetical protein